VLIRPQIGVSPLVGCPRQLIKYSRTYPLYLEAVFSYAVVTGTHLAFSPNDVIVE